MILARLKNLPLGMRLALACTVAELCLLAILVLAAAGVLEDRLLRQTSLRANDVAELLIASLTDPLVRRDFGQLEEIAKAAQDKEYIDYVLVSDLTGRTLALAGWPTDRPTPIPQTELDTTLARHLPRIDIRRPVLIAGHTYGHLQFGISTQPFIQAKTDLIRQLAILGGVVIAMSIGLFALVGHLLTQSLGALTESVERLAEGDLDIRLPGLSHDEVGRLEQAFNRMADSLRERLTQLQGNERQLNALVDKLSQSNLELERFAYIASHDLQEPLRTVVNYTQLLQRRLGGRLDGDLRDYLGFVVSGATRMHELVRDLLAYSRADATVSAPQSVDMAEVMNSVRETLSATIAESAARLTVGGMPTVIGQKMQLYELMQNLVGNAIKFHRPNSGSEVIVSAESTEDGWRFAVSDNGIGIPPQHRIHIFEIFRRLHSSDTYAGTGIGLAVCKRIVERHGGRIWVESEVGAGTTFFFTLPRSAERSANSI